MKTLAREQRNQIQQSLLKYPRFPRHSDVCAAANDEMPLGNNPRGSPNELLAACCAAEKQALVLKFLSEFIATPEQQGYSGSPEYIFEAETWKAI